LWQASSDLVERFEYSQSFLVRKSTTSHWVAGLHPPTMFEYLLGDIFQILQSNLSASNQWNIWVSAKFTP
jgi:hypothetical protein